MDNEFLKKNVLPALTEALGAMAIQVPEDKVEFVGRYLLKYVERKEYQQNRNNEIATVEKKLAIQSKIDEEQEKILKEKIAPIQHVATQYQRLLEGILLRPSKEDAADVVVNFLESTMNLPAAYYAVKVTVGESEYIKYLAAGPASKGLVGVKLNKPVTVDETAEEFVERQGLSFEAFKVPEVPEEEVAEEAEGVEVPKKGPPPLQNLIVRNVMLDRRIKFFGIPKLGAYVAAPFKYASYDHDGAVRFNPGDGAEVAPSFELVKADYSFLIAFDSIGQYRHFSEEEINRVVTIGNTLIQLYEKLEGKAAEKQLEYLNGPSFKKLNDTVTEVVTKLVEDEAAALAAVQPAEGAEPPPPEIAEFIKPKKDSAAIIGAWNKAVGAGTLGPQINASLQQYLLPLASPALKLLYVIGLFLNYDSTTVQDVAGDLTWDLLKKSFLPTLASKIASFQPDAQITLTSGVNQLASIKAYLETNTLTDASIYPNFLPLFPNLLLPWLSKAITAREAAITYATEVDKKSLEIFN